MFFIGFYNDDWALSILLKLSSLSSYILQNFCFIIIYLTLRFNYFSLLIYGNHTYNFGFFGFIRFSFGFLVKNVCNKCKVKFFISLTHILCSDKCFTLYFLCLFQHSLSSLGEITYPQSILGNTSITRGKVVENGEVNFTILQVIAEILYTSL